MNAPRKYSLVLAIYPNARGFAYVLFEGPLAPVDWAVVEVRGKLKNRQCIRRVSQLFGTFEPDAVTLQHMDEALFHRAARIRDLNESLALLAGTQGIPVFTFSRTQVRHCFVHLGSVTKQTVAEYIAKHIPAFERFLPPIRKIWMSEDARMGMFDAAALGLTFFQNVAAKQDEHAQADNL
jgi:Holliday junction resolvasome RuvABC endonuclease subunit